MALLARSRVALPGQRTAVASPLVAGRRALHVARAKTESVDLAPGTPAPFFELADVVSGKKVSINDYKGTPATLVMFICNHCPYVVHLKHSFVEIANEYGKKGLKVVAISSNSTQTHPQDGPEKMKEDAIKYGYPFPYLFDESQEVAKAYFAACTPEFYVFDKDLKLTYHGQWDATRPKQDPPHVPTAADIRAALDATLAGTAAPKSRPSIGCNIKWTPGKEPEYYGAQIVKK
ncbi:hypothetical protein HXX76_005587 [Chlamydomonas incerta]|uniref:Thioredoxin domain-containing protein n=1 Tax=Chlamydomonas incerta TaxID=51695 RepID=A0A835T6N1_CHLIN|nr:hypothetical protein HXX76_005587 [Chlamydomonas incerta]|eukprot:KAG2437972.1 hypothetical protein HXX76_005587 [Chlamydomonas incerta]